MLNESHVLWPSPIRSVLLNQAAALLGVSRRTIYYRIREGKLRTVRTRGGSQRVLVDSIELLLREGSRRRSGRRKRLLETEALPLEVEALS
jgi:excisionase family DNA binding protein